MKILISVFVCVIFITFLSTATAMAKAIIPYQMYLGNLKPNQHITLFSSPDINNQNCTLVKEKNSKNPYCKEATGWPNRDADIYVISTPVKAKYYNTVTRKESTEDFVQVKYSYDVPKSAEFPSGKRIGIGFIRKKILTEKPYKGFYEVKKKEDCEPLEKKQPHQNSAEVFKNPATDLSPHLNLSVLDSVVDQIYPQVGKCPFSPTYERAAKDTTNSYDTYIKPILQKTVTPNVNFKNHKLTHDDLVSIDTLSRTLYGEMGGCFEEGLQYPITVACVMLNRLKNKDTPENRFEEFTDSDQDRSKTPLTQLIVSPRKFNNWLLFKDSADKIPNGPFYQGACPPTEVNKTFWAVDRVRKTTSAQAIQQYCKGKKKDCKIPALASDNDVDTWKDAVRIATDAVLDSDNFLKNKCGPELKDIYFYTSEVDIKPIEKYELIHPKVNGRIIKNGTCLKVWKEVSEDEQLKIAEQKKQSPAKRSPAKTNTQKKVTTKPKKKK